MRMKHYYSPDYEAIEKARKQMPDEPQLNRRIDYLPILDKNWGRVLNVLERVGIATLKDLLVYSKDEVSHFRNLGAKSCGVLFQAVEALGLHFREEKKDE